MDKDTLFSSFRKWVAPLNTTLISNWTLETGEDRYVKKLDTLAYLLIFIDAQLQQHRGLRDIAADLCHNEAFQQELGLRCISTSQLSRKNNKLSHEILQQLFCDLVQQISQQSHPHPSRVGQVKLLDSTTVSLCLQKYKWAEYRKTKAGIKLHVRVAFGDPDTVYPDKVELTPAKPADRTQMDTLIDDKGVTYIFDRGYVDYDKFNGYSLDGTFFVTRLKDNAVMETLHEFDTAKDSPISRDRMVKLGQGKKQTRMVFRVIETLDLKGKPIQILSNRFDLTAEEIGDLYRNRWKIETFFRWIKQHLKLTRFYGEQEQAVWNQIWMCLIAYALLLLTKMELATNKSLREVGRLLKVMKYRSWEAFREVIHRKPLRTSKGRPKVSES